MDNAYLLPINRRSSKVENKATIIMCFIILFLVNYILRFFRNTDLFSLSIWFLLCIILLLKHLQFFLKYILYFFGNTLNILGVYVIENNSIYLYELGTHSIRYDSLFLITLTHCVFSLVLLTFDASIKKRVDKYSKFAKIRIGQRRADKYIIYFFLSFFMVAIIYMLSKTIVNSAGKNQMDRFVYQATYIKGMWDILHTYIIYLIPIFVIVAFRKKFLISFPLVIGYCIYMYLTGNKFGSFLTIFAFYIPFIIKRFKLDRFNQKSLIKVLLIGGILAVSLYYVLYSVMSNTYGFNGQRFYTYLYDRLAQQGQIWWAIYGKEQHGGFHFDQLSVSIGSLFGIDKEVIKSLDYGMYKMMKLVTPYNIYQAKIESGSRYTTSTQATLYYYFKTVGLIGFTGLLAILVSYIINWYWREIENGSWFGSIISGFFYTLIYAVYSQSDFNIFFSKRKFLVLFVFLIIRLVNRLDNRKKINLIKQA